MLRVTIATWVTLATLLFLPCRPAHADRASAHYHKAMSLKRQGKIVAAIRALKQALRYREGYAAAHRSIGILYRRKNRLGLAAHHLERAAKLQPKAGDVYYSLALVYYKRGDKAKARKTMAKAARLNPKDAQIVGQLGIMLIRVDPFKAAAALKKALKLKPNDARFQHQLGLAYRRASVRVGRDANKRKKYMKLAAKYLVLASAKIDSAGLHFDLGVLYRRLEKPRKAIAHYQQAVQKNPRMAAAWWDLGHMYSRTKQHDEAIKAFRRYLRLKGRAKDAKIARERIKALKQAKRKRRR